MEERRQETPQLDRRKFLQVLAGGGLLVSGGLLSGCGSSSGTSTPPSPPSPVITPKTLTIPGIQPGISNLSNQRCPEWCWAACSEMIVRQFGIDVSNLGGADVAQEYFARKVYGAITPNLCQPATPPQVAFALTDSYHLLGSGAPISLQGYFLPQVLGTPIPVSFNATSVRLLQNQIPFMILLNPVGSDIEHFLLVYSLTYHQDQFGNVIIDAFQVADPFAPYYTQGSFQFPTYYDASNIQAYNQQAVAWAQLAAQAPFVKKNNQRKS